MLKLCLYVFFFLFLNNIILGQITMHPNVIQTGILQKSQLWNISVVCLNDDNPETIFEITLTDRVTGLPVLIGTSTSIKLTKGVKLFSESELTPISYTSPNAQFDI